MRRRQFNLVALSAGASVAVGGVVALFSLRNPRRIGKLVDHSRDVAELGREFLKEDGRLRMGMGDIPEETALAQETLLRRVDSDLEQNDLVLVNGWMISRTEAELAALVAMEFEGD